VLASREYENAVLDDISLARRMGISGVPFFAIDRKYAISGAQSPETFLHALRTAYAAEASPAS
jgi:predicted DsbA family dithiol-disulfide isomerase